MVRRALASSMASKLLLFAVALLLAAGWAGAVVVADPTGPASCRGPSCVAISGTGDATACQDELRATFACVAASGLGAAGACNGLRGLGCAAASATGGASACAGIADGLGCAAVTATGSATACRGAFGSACAAASGTGPATCGRGCAAVSGTGDATSGDTAVSGTGNAYGPSYCVVSFFSRCLLAWRPVSGTGHAAGGISGCDALSALGRPEACVDPV
jgi:hypothetical protein